VVGDMRQAGGEAGRRGSEAGLEGAKLVVVEGAEEERQGHVRRSGGVARG
jgi:hypothetical protein